jgi:general secretion pathway protein K
LHHRAGGARRLRTGRKSESGVALITAILVVALATIAATAMLVSISVAIHRTSTLQDSEKAWWYAEGVESWVRSILQRDQENNQTDSFADIWAKPVDYLPTDEGFIRGHVEDLQGRFNLNNFGVQDKVRYQRYVTQFERLLENIKDADPSQAKPLADAIHDWIDADSEPFGINGAEDTEYLTYSPPYRTANRPLASVTEVLAIKGMNKKLYELLTHCSTGPAGPVSCITALPEFPTAININTAPEPVLASLVQQPNAALQAFVESRVKTPAGNAQVAFQPPPNGFITAADGTTQDMITVSSHYFLLDAQAFIGSGRVALYSFFLRPAKGVPVLLGRSTGIE